MNPCRYSWNPSCTAALSTLATKRLAVASAVPSKPTRSPISTSSCGVCREYFPRPPQTWIPSSRSNGVSPRFNAPMTLVVIPEECQSMPMTAPNDCAADRRDLLRRWLREPVPLVNDEGANRIRRSTEHEFVGQHHERRRSAGAAQGGLSPPHRPRRLCRRCPPS